MHILLDTGSILSVWEYVLACRRAAGFGVFLKIQKMNFYCGTIFMKFWQIMEPTVYLGLFGGISVTHFSYDPKPVSTGFWINAVCGDCGRMASSVPSPHFKEWAK